MKKSKQLLVFSFFLFAVPFYYAHATRVMGSEMSYQWISGNTFQFNLSVYRDCGSANSIPNRQKIFYSSFSCRPTQDSISLTLVGSPVDVSPLCKRSPSNCEGGINPGIQRFNYVGTVTLPQRCSDWVFYFRLCNRSANIGTLINPSENCLYIEARLNNLLAPNNSSPKISNEAIVYFCKGQAANFNPGVTDINGDKLNFKLVAPRTNSIIPNVVDQNIIAFKPGFSIQNPFPTVNGFLFDSLSGQLDFVPSQVINGVNTVRISEFRNGKLIGSIMYDIPIISRDCENTLPSISGFNSSTNFEQLICIGDSIDTEFTANDDNLMDTLRFSWNEGIVGAKFIPDSGKATAKARLKWTPSISDTGIKSFTITVTDDACPSFGTTTKTFQFRVALKPTISSTADTLIPCGVQLPISANVLSGKAPFLFSWRNRNNTTQIINVSHGEYNPKVSDATGCFVEDTILVKGSSISGYIKQDTSCLVEGVQLTAMPSALDTSLTYTYEWTFPSESQIFTEKVLRRTFPTTGERSVSLKITGSDDCSVTIPTSFFVCPPPPFIARYAPDICQGEQFRLGCGIPGVGGLCGAWSICVILTDRNWINFPTSGIQVLPPDSLRPDSNSFKIITRSFNQCSNEKEFKFKVKPSPKIKIVPNNRYIRYNCFKPDTTVLVKIFKDFRYPFDSLWARIQYLDTTINLPKTRNDTIFYNLRLSKPCIVTIQGIMKSNCMAYESLAYQPAAQAIANPTAHCKVGDTVSIKPIFFKEPLTSFSLYPGIGQVLQDSSVRLQYPENQVFKGFFAVRDSLGCRDTARFEIDTRLPDSTVVFSEDSACKNGLLTIAIRDTNLVYEWRFQNNLEISILNKKKMLDTLTVDIPGNLIVKAQMSFKQGCIRKWDLPPVYVRQPIIPKISLENVCADNMSFLFGSTLVSELPIEKWNWDYTLIDSNTVVYLKDSVQNPGRIFDYNGPFRSVLTVFDVKGCSAKDTLDSIMVKVSKPEFFVNGNCQNDSLIFFTGRGIDKNENIDRFTYFYNDGSVENTGNGQGLHQFVDPGSYIIKAVAYSVEGCTNKFEDTLVIKPRPKAVFSVSNPEICFGIPIKVNGINSKPAATDQQITSYVWATNESNPISENVETEVLASEPGPAFVALQVKSSNGCQDYLKIPFQVRPNPIAGFERNEAELEFADAVSFKDLSSGVSSWEWDFGDGQSILVEDSIRSSPTHTYTFGSSFVVKQLVTNAFGCVDSAKMDVNLKSFIALPNAFSPNGDGKNEGCGLIHRYVKDLTEFKIYNRLGQIVFDAGKDISSRWNGTLQGVNQPNGNYLYFAKATSVFGENLELKGTLTLIR